MFLVERVRSKEEVILGEKASYIFLGEKAMQVVDGFSREKSSQSSAASTHSHSLTCAEACGSVQSIQKQTNKGGV
jgi:hypothetical protein